ncbi:hypothetical protein QE364_003183 [Nocardioides zeae]|uniref:Uncharacterized protein n=1 Tax=Nocardioides zeae TaxID=1457234 RepID=A0ACC6IL88_9ACTN|nr:hypothetical protein [Nocardioides zeae]MDR6173986.1 hypothetical protein [Nocardioides zeae]MDR6211459.1 hypothetical protein [Nocardioides zeae]
MSCFGPSSLAGVLLGAFGMVVMAAALSQAGAGAGALAVGLVIAAVAALAVACVSPVAWVRHVATGAVCGIAGAALLNAFLGEWVVSF